MLVKLHQEGKTSEPVQQFSTAEASQGSAFVEKLLLKTCPCMHPDYSTSYLKSSVKRHWYIQNTLIKETTLSEKE